MKPAERAPSLAALYEEVHQFAASRDRGDTPLRPRRVVARALDGDLVLLAQGLAQSTQRVTGYPYRKPSGLSPAGHRLDDFLRPLAYTIDHTDSSRVYVYSTDLVPWYPGRNPTGKGDLRPSPADVELCWSYFERECGLVRPRAVVLLGRWAADRYLRRYGRERLGGPLAQAVGRCFETRVNGMDVTAVAAYHPSAIWGAFERVGRENWAGAVAALGPILA